MITEQQAQVGQALSAATYDNIAIVTINGVTYERKNTTHYFILV